MTNLKHEQDNNIFIRLFFVIMLVTMVLFLLPMQSEFGRDSVMFYNNLFFTLYISGMVIIVVLVKKQTNLISLYGILFFTIIVGISLRIFAIHFLQTECISDFLTPHNFYQHYQNHGAYVEGAWSEKDFYQLYYSRFPAWYPYMKVVSFIYDIFGFNIQNIQTVNIILSAATMLAIFWCAKLIQDEKIGLIAVTIFAWNPSLIMYSSITTPDHFSIFFIVLLIIFWIYAEKNRQMWRRSYKAMIYPIFLGISTMFIGFFKPVAPLVIVALICYEFAVYIYPAFRARMDFKKICKEIISYGVFCISLVCLFVFLGNRLVESSIYSTFKTDVVDSTGFYIYAGFAVDENGKYDSNKISERFMELMEEYNNDQIKVFEKLSEESKQQLKESIPYIGQIISDKIEVLVSEYGYFGFSNTSSDQSYAQSINQTLSSPLLMAATVNMRIMYILSAILMLYLIFQKKINKMILISSIVLFGYIAVLLISGIQGRYKSIIIPLWCIISAYCAFMIYELVSNKVLRILEKRKNKT